MNKIIIYLADAFCIEIEEVIKEEKKKTCLLSSNNRRKKRVNLLTRIFL